MLGCVVVLVSCSNTNNDVLVDSSVKIEENKKRGSVSKYDLPKDGNYYECALKDSYTTSSSGECSYLYFEKTNNTEAFSIKEGKFCIKYSDTYIYSDILMLAEDSFTVQFYTSKNQWYIYDTIQGYVLARYNNGYTYYILGK